MEIMDLSNQPVELRNTQWENKFFNAFVSGQVELINEDPQMGPDGWPYLYLKTTAEAKEPTKNVLHWASENGVGVAINPDKAVPDMILSYGMIWNFRERAQFITASEATHLPGEFEIKGGTSVKAAAPSESYLPQYVRNILKMFFLQQKIENPKVVLLSTDEKHYDLVFSAESLGSPENEEYDSILHAISWFLPTHYSLVLASESEIPNFESL